MRQVRRLPEHHDSNGWWETLPHAPEPRRVKGEVRVKTAIVGGGICGISVANRLGELCPNDDICLIEAERVGFGASGRNAGFMLNLHSHGPPKNLDVLRRNMKFWQTGLDSLRNKVEEWQIQCDWNEAGRLYGAAGPDGEKRLSEISATLEALGLHHDRQDRGEIAKRIGTEFYSSALCVPGSALVNPAAMMRGLARNLPANVQLFENTPVVSFARENDGYRIVTRQGQIQADRLVLATGVFLKDFGIATGKFVPMATYASLTNPLDPESLRNLGTGEEFGLLGGSEVGSTVRLTRDNRLFLRNHYNFEPGRSASAARISDIATMHRKALTIRWPALSSIGFEHSWGGAMAFTTNNGTVFGEYGPNLYAILTNDVSPMTRGEATGALLAEHMEGLDSDLLSLQLALPDARRLPPRPFLDAGISMRRWLKNATSGREV